jgi:DNA-binding Lrp family transcriptional regulator
MSDVARNAKRDAESGRFERTYEDAAFLDAVRTHAPAGTTEVADEVGCQRQAADYRLRKLADDGKVDHKKVGASAVWTLPEDKEEGR